MAMRRHNNPVMLGLLALMLVFPPLTSVVAGGFGLDLSHHHCGDEVHDSTLSHHDGGVAVEETADQHIVHLERHGANQSEPFQCDQCHAAFAALATDLPAALVARSSLPSPGKAAILFAVRPPSAFKPPIA